MPAYASIIPPDSSTSVSVAVTDSMGFEASVELLHGRRVLTEFERKKATSVRTWEQTTLLCRKTGNYGRRLTWVNRKLPEAQEETKEWKAEQQRNMKSLGPALGVEMRKIKAQLELTGDIKDHSRGFYRHMCPESRKKLRGMRVH